MSFLVAPGQELGPEVGSGLGSETVRMVGSQVLRAWTKAAGFHLKPGYGLWACQLQIDPAANFDSITVILNPLKENA